MATAFISYTHRDETFRQELEAHLAPLRRQGLLDQWHDRRMTAGDALDDTISAHLERADLILMLISADFVASDYCYAKEMARALERHEARQARAISIICRPCDFQGLPFANFVLLPTDAKAVSSWPDRDAAWVDVVRGIRNALGADRGPSPSPRPPRVPRDAVATAKSGGPARPPLPRRTTDLQMDQFAVNAMRDIARYFNKELDMLEMRDPDWKGVFHAIDANRFTSQVYFREKELASCTVFRGGMGPRTIHYSQGIISTANSWNEALTVEADEGGPYLKPMGMAVHFGGQRPNRLEPFDAAEFLFEMLMDQARSRIRVNAQTLVAKVWNFAHVLRDQGVSYQAYISQISYLLFLKMDEERVTQIGEASMLPGGSRWSDIRDLAGEALNTAYVKLLDTLSRQGGIIGAIFLKAQNEIQDPAKLKRLVGLIDGETWLGLPVDVKGSIYEGLLARNAEDVKSGAGQYFTPRPLIEAMVAAVDPKPHQTVHDPACGTAGFLLAAWDHMKPKAKDRALYQALKGKFSGVDIVPEVVRLAAMNLYLHGITGVDSIVEAKDALLGAGGKSYDVVLTNPPFGKKQSYRIVRDDGEIDSEREDYDRQDFFVTTSNKQLNFLQHIMTVLAPDGEAAVVLPDNVLFEGGAGETIRRRLLRNFDFHTLLRLPTGIFYKQGVKANVLFFDKKPPSDEAATRDLWIYDLRTNRRFTLKERPMVRADLDDFLACYRSGRRFERAESERFRRFPLDALLARDKVNLDIFWLKDDALDDPDLLPAPDEVAAEIVESLEAALQRFRAVAVALGER